MYPKRSKGSLAEIGKWARFHVYSGVRIRIFGRRKRTYVAVVENWCEDPIEEDEAAKDIKLSPPGD